MNSHQRAKERAAIKEEMLQGSLSEIANFLELGVAIPPRVSNTLSGQIRRYNGTFKDSGDMTMQFGEGRNRT